ncbi:MAG: ABC transporter ATP-binding protein [Treponemataceae bacterium]|nr:MAG: ABC transporter ATP-binding protein [Treponemataceae bacterium]
MKDEVADELVGELTDELIKEYDSRIVKRLFTFIAPYKKLILAALITLIVSTAGELAVPVSIRHLADSIIQSAAQHVENTAAAAEMHRTIDAGFVRGKIVDLYKSIFALFGILALVFGANFFQILTTNRIGQLAMKDIRLRLFKTTANQSLDFLSKQPVGRIVTRLTGDVETLNQFFTQVLAGFLKDFSIMLGVLVTIFVMSPRLAFISVIFTVPAAIFATNICRKKARDAFRRQRTASSALTSFFSEALGGIQVVQLFCREKDSVKKFGVLNDELTNANLGEMYVYATFRPVIDFLLNLSIAIIIFSISIFSFGSEHFSAGLLIAFIGLIQMFFAPIQDIADKYTMLQSAMAGGERVFQLMDTDECIDRSGTGTAPVRGHIKFDDVHFSYKKNKEILRGLSFEIAPGEKAAIVGATGAGKTTIINVLTRLWDIDSGAIVMDGIPLRERNLDALRRDVLPVAQDVFLFSGTITDNIRLGLDISDAQVVSACKACHAHEFISHLTDGYDTKLSEGAANISSG